MAMIPPGGGDPIPVAKLPTTPQAPAPAQAVTPSPAAEAPAPAPQEQIEIQPMAGQSQAPLVSLVQEGPAELKASGEKIFASRFKAKPDSYLRSDNPALLSALKDYHSKIEGDHAMKVAIGRNPRGIDFLNALEDAAKGKKLSRDDIQSIQLFLAKDTRYGAALATKSDPAGIDGKFGVRTMGTLDQLISHFQPADLVSDAYYDRLDKEGIPYEKLK